MKGRRLMRKLILICLFTVLLTGRAYAMQAEQSEGNKVRISGSFNEDEIVTVRIIGPDAEPEDYYNADLETQKSMLVHFDQVMPYDGFEYVFTLGGNTGKYYALFSQEDISETAEFDFINMEEQKNIIDELCSILDKTSDKTLNSFVKKYGEKLSGSIKFNQIKDEGISDIANNITSGFTRTGDYSADYGTLCGIMYKGVIRESVFDAGITADELTEYAEVLGIKDTEEYKLFLENTAEYASLPQKLSAARCADENSFIKQFSEGMLLCRVEKTQHISQIYPLVEELKKYGYDTGRYFSLQSTNNADMKIVGKSFDTCEEMAEFVKSICLNITESTGSVSGGGGGASGGGSSGSSSKSASSAPVSIVKTNTSAENNVIFSDVNSSHWAFESIRVLYKNGIVNGNENNCFEPERDVCREEFVKMLVCAFKINAESGECSFEDVLPDSWFYNYVAAAQKYGIVNGISEDKFGAGIPITRQDAVLMAYNAAGFRSYNIPSEQEAAFDDYEDIDTYARDAVKAIAGAGVINGYDGRFYPKKNITRAEAAKMVYYIMKNIMN